MKCNNCKEDFTPASDTQIVCSYNCASELIEKKRLILIEKSKKEIKDRKLAYKKQDKALIMRNTVVVFNKFIRERDGNVCISCGNTTRQMHAGHYRPAGVNLALRFDENNVHSQCVQCNTFLSGNLVEYRKNLIKKIGLNEVERLENNKEVKKYTAIELKQIGKTYRDKNKKSKNENN